MPGLRNLTDLLVEHSAPNSSFPLSIIGSFPSGFYCLSLTRSDHPTNIAELKELRSLRLTGAYSTQEVVASSEISLQLDQVLSKLWRLSSRVHRGYLLSEHALSGPSVGH